MDGFENFINAIVIDYDGGDVAINGYVYKVTKPQFKFVKRSAFAKYTNYMKEIVKYGRQNCSIPTCGLCFNKFVNYFSEKDYTEEILVFIRTEKYQPGVTTSARFQPFCRKCNINIGRFGGKRINPRNISQRITSLSIHNNHFCLI